MDSLSHARWEVPDDEEISTCQGILQHLLCKGDWISFLFISQTTTKLFPQREPIVNSPSLLFLCLSVCLSVSLSVCFTVCMSVCWGRICSETAKRIWLKFCTDREVCPGHCVSHVNGNQGRVTMLRHDCTKKHLPPCFFRDFFLWKNLSSVRKN